MLQRYKEEHGLSNKELAQLMGVEVITVYRILKNEHVGPKSIRAIAKLLNVKEIDVYAYYKQSKAA